MPSALCSPAKEIACFRAAAACIRWRADAQKLYPSSLAQGSSNGFKHPADNVRESVPILLATVCSVAKVEARFSSGRVRQTDEQLPRASEGAVLHSDHMLLRSIGCAACDALFERRQASHR